MSSPRDGRRDRRVAGAVPFVAVASAMDPESGPPISMRKATSVARLLLDEIRVENDVPAGRCTFSAAPDECLAVKQHRSGQEGSCRRDTSPRQVAVIGGTSNCSDVAAAAVASLFCCTSIDYDVAVVPLLEMLADDRSVVCSDKDDASAATTASGVSVLFRARANTTTFVLNRVEALCTALAVAQRALGTGARALAPSLILSLSEWDLRIAPEQVRNSITHDEQLEGDAFVQVLFEATATMSESTFHRLMARSFNDQTCGVEANRVAAITALYEGRTPPRDVMARRALAQEIVRRNAGGHCTVAVPELLLLIVKDTTLLRDAGLLLARGSHFASSAAADERAADAALALFDMLEAFPVAACCESRFVHCARRHLRAREAELQESGSDDAVTVFDVYCDSFARVVSTFGCLFPDMYGDDRDGRREDHEGSAEGVWRSPPPPQETAAAAAAAIPRAADGELEQGGVIPSTVTASPAQASRETPLTRASDRSLEAQEGVRAHPIGRNSHAVRASSTTPPQPNELPPAPTPGTTTALMRRAERLMGAHRLLAAQHHHHYDDNHPASPATLLQRVGRGCLGRGMVRFFHSLELARIERLARLGPMSVPRQLFDAPSEMSPREAGGPRSAQTALRPAATAGFRSPLVVNFSARRQRRPEFHDPEAAPPHVASALSPPKAPSPALSRSPPVNLSTAAPTLVAAPIRVVVPPRAAPPHLPPPPAAVGLTPGAPLRQVPRDASFACSALLDFDEGLRQAELDLQLERNTRLRSALPVSNGHTSGV